MTGVAQYDDQGEGQTSFSCRWNQVRVRVAWTLSFVIRQPHEAAAISGPGWKSEARRAWLGDPSSEYHFTRSLPTSENSSQVLLPSPTTNPRYSKTMGVSTLPCRICPAEPRSAVVFAMTSD